MSVRLYIDTNRQVFVAGFSSITVPDLHPLKNVRYGDVISLRIYLLEPNPDTNGAYPVPYSYMEPTVGLKVAIGDRGTGVMVPVAYQNSWTPNGEQKYQEADLSIATAEALAAFAGVAPYTKTLEIKIVEAAGDRTVIQETVTIHPRAVSPTTVVPAATDEPISKNYAEAAYLKKEATESDFRIWQSSNGRRWKEWVNDDGIKQLEELVAI